MSNDLQLWERFLQSDKKALSAIFLDYHDDLVPLWLASWPAIGIW